MYNLGKGSWIQITLILGCLLISPGCHLLLRRGEEPSEPDQTQEEPANNAAPEPAGKPPLPGLGPELPGPPLPGLPGPPLPGLPGPPLPGLPAEESRGDHDTRAEDTSLSKIGRLRRILGNTGINTNTAVKPGQGQYVYRTQLRFLEAHSSPGPVDRDVNLLINPQLLAYGVRENLTLIGVAPVVLREGTARPPAPPGAFTDLGQLGVADLRLFGVYRFHTEDLPGETTRWAGLAGLEVPTYDTTFSSKSWDPFVGSVWTHQSLQWGLDLDLVWQFNTGRGLAGDDRITYNAAYTYVLLTGQSLVDKQIWAMNSVLEINGSYTTDGSHLVYIAPGFQLALEAMIVEASLQLPVIRDLKDALEPDFLFAVGTRITW